jgi:hypothetical protein
MLSAVPQVLNERWYVPVQPFFAFLGGTVEFPATGEIHITRGKTKISLQVNENQAFINNQEMNLVYPVLITKGVAMVAAEDLTKLSGFSYKYDSQLNMLMFAK